MASLSLSEEQPWVSGGCSSIRWQYQKRLDAAGSQGQTGEHSISNRPETGPEERLYGSTSFTIHIVWWISKAGYFVEVCFKLDFAIYKYDII